MMETGRTNAPFCLGFIAILGLICALGCNHDAHRIQTGPTERILPPPNASGFQGPAVPQPSVQAAVEVKPVSLEQAQPPAELPSRPQAVAAPNQDRESGGEFRQALDLPGAIATAFRIQPKLRVALERIQQARAKEDIAFSAFLPLLTTGYSVGNFDLNVGGPGIPVAGTPYTFLPPGGALPVGLNAQQDYTLAEMRLQWLVCDFGRRMGHYNQAGLAADIAELQTERAYQTVANEVATAYYQVLRIRSLDRIAT